MEDYCQNRQKPDCGIEIVTTEPDVAQRKDGQNRQKPDCGIEI